MEASEPISELTPIIFHIELTHLGSKAPIYAILFHVQLFFIEYNTILFNINLFVTHSLRKIFKIIPIEY